MTITTPEQLAAALNIHTDTVTLSVMTMTLKAFLREHIAANGETRIVGRVGKKAETAAQCWSRLYGVRFTAKKVRK